ncbi:hypothetical protein MMC19_000790 [Ptychographa xylographoides]|nr:hypothetical protein [Ptychographa xylographoides]
MRRPAIAPVHAVDRQPWSEHNGSRYVQPPTQNKQDDDQTPLGALRQMQAEEWFPINSSSHNHPETRRKPVPKTYRPYRVPLTPAQVDDGHTDSSHHSGSSQSSDKIVYDKDGHISCQVSKVKSLRQLAVHRPPAMEKHRSFYGQVENAGSLSSGSISPIRIDIPKFGKQDSPLTEASSSPSPPLEIGKCFICRIKDEKWIDGKLCDECIVHGFFDSQPLYASRPSINDPSAAAATTPTSSSRNRRATPASTARPTPSSADARGLFDPLNPNFFNRDVGAPFFDNVPPEPPLKDEAQLGIHPALRDIQGQGVPYADPYGTLKPLNTTAGRDSMVPVPLYTSGNMHRRPQTPETGMLVSPLSLHSNSSGWPKSPSQIHSSDEERDHTWGKAEAHDDEEEEARSDTTKWWDRGGYDTKTLIGTRSSILSTTTTQTHSALSQTPASLAGHSPDSFASRAARRPNLRSSSIYSHYPPIAENAPSVPELPRRTPAAAAMGPRADSRLQRQLRPRHRASSVYSLYAPAVADALNSVPPPVPALPAGMAGLSTSKMEQGGSGEESIGEEATAKADAEAQKVKVYEAWRAARKARSRGKDLG